MNSEPALLVVAVVVTRDRREMLCKCLDAIIAQTRQPDRIVVVDNASEDGTPSMLREQYPSVDLIALQANQGGAGGFHEGMKRAHAAGADWIWLADDDTIPAPDALAELLAAVTALGGMAMPTLLASRVLWRDGQAHPMNFPTLERRRIERVIAAAERGITPMRAATFVSLLVHRGVVDRHGLPLKHFFLWSDDIEYTSRAVLGDEIAYFVPSSVVLHDTAAPTDHRFASPERFYFHARNTLFMARQRERPRRDRLIRAWVFVSTSTAYVARHRSAASAWAVIRGLSDGLRAPERAGRGTRHGP